LIRKEPDLMRPNKLIAHLATGQSAYAPTCTLGCPDTVEIACHSGFDYVFIDGQHGLFDKNAIRESIRAAQTTDVTPIVRPSANNSPGEIEWILDQGAEGLICPMVSTAQQARDIVQSAYYTPRGTRSAGGGRTITHFGTDYHRQANEQILVVVMIESVEGINNVNEIAAVDGIDGVKVGTGDLAMSLGGTAEQVARGEVPGMEDALQTVLDAARKAGKIPGIYCPKVADALQRVEQGFQLITIDYEFNIIRSAMRQMVEELHATR
jgi:4-hydroxy-2-oxoheptanedioate aldolase